MGKKFTNGENSFDVNINYPAASGYSQIAHIFQGVGYLNQDGEKYTNEENSFDVNNYPAPSGYSEIEAPRTVVTTSPKSTSRRIRTAYTTEQLVELKK
ncbi:hypothetical protein JTB14_035188 [Gonioctena quinquepunctata]|nr:hypothetical protein JTB14_035188 [Gonioctena quinquepunctata]